MGFQTPLYELTDYLKWTINGRIQLPGFRYLSVIERKASVAAAQFDGLSITYLVDTEALPADDIGTHIVRRRDALTHLVEAALGETVEGDIDAGASQEGWPTWTSAATP